MATSDPTIPRGGSTESALRERLQVPTDAPRVMVVSESTHWDPNWLCTSTEYFRWRVRRCLDRAIDALVAEPRRVFSLECLFFPELYWEARPERRDLFRSLVNERRLRFTGSGVTTPDTLLPEDELLLRDLLIGQEWLRARAMTQEPRMLYLPDSFGHSPGLPSLLGAAGLTGVAVTRIDGMRFPGADLESADTFPRPGTSAEHLLTERTADFVWSAPDGQEVLAHWMTFGYGHGDMIASGGLSRTLGLPTSWPDRRERRVHDRIRGYIDELTSVARTPYLLLGIGFDFVAPIPDLVDLLDRWNDTEYERTGVWLVNAGIDDYLDLVAHHRHLLPTLRFDPNPYWLGFYASRPDIKIRCRDLGRKLITLDNEQARAAMASARPAVGSLDDEQRRRAWWRAVTSNHHDYITGTSPDRVANGEQTRWLDEALSDVASASTPSPGSPPDDAPATVSAPEERGPAGLELERRGHLVTIRSATLAAVFDEQRGGALIELTDRNGRDLVVAPSLELRSYAESGGLWRMGHEFNGGRWCLVDRSSQQPAEVAVTIDDHGVEQVQICASLEGRPVEITVELGRDEPQLIVHTSVTAPRRRTVTLAVHLTERLAGLLMHQPGAMVARGLERWYDPTFWPLHSFAAALPVGPAGDDTPVAVTAATAVPTALHASPTGLVEAVVARTATKEVAFGVVPVLAPAWGLRWGTQAAAIGWSWSHAIGVTDVGTVGRRLQADADRTVGRSTPDWLVVTDDPLVEVIAVKVADRGEGIIVRLRSWAEPASGTRTRLTLAPGVRNGPATVTDAWQTDSCERDLERLAVRDGAVEAMVDAHLTTVRLILRGGDPATPRPAQRRGRMSKPTATHGPVGSSR